MRPRLPRSRRALWAWGVAGVVLVASAVWVLVYVIWLDDGDVPPGPEDQLETVPAEGVAFEATVRLGEEGIEYEYRITNERDAPVVVVDPSQLPVGSPAEEGPDGLWRALAVRPVEAAPLLDLRGGTGGGSGRSARGLLLEPGQTHAGQVAEMVVIDDPPEQVDLCVEVVDDGGVEGAGGPDGSGGSEDVALTDRPRGVPVAVACTGPVPVDA
jgi:hypothetical protein